MCALCGILGDGRHWTESASHPEVFGAGAPTRRAERQARTRLFNRILAHYGLSLAEWAGAGWVLKGPTGRTVLVDDPSRLWPAAEALAGRPCDPLDEALLAAIGAPGEAEGGR